MFQVLAKQWLRETALYASLSKKVLHPAYQRIIGLGPDAIPLILKELEVRPNHWFWALEALAQGDVPKLGDDFSLAAARSAWIQWGRDKGYL
jgi:hypothetical protein